MSATNDHRLLISQLLCEDQVDPLGIDSPRPRLAWKFSASRRTQSAYQVLVASRPELLVEKAAPDLWDSGRIESDSTIRVEYAGAALSSAQRAYWTVRIWGDPGSAMETDRSAFWEMGLLNSADWKATWIAGLSPTAIRLPAAHLRKSFSCERKTIRRARLYATAQGIYVGFINSQRVGNDLFRPGWTEYRKRIQYQTYDVTSFVAQGDNAIGFILGDGWFSGELGWKDERNRYGTTPRLLAQLQIDYDDGSSQTIVTDGAWKCSPGPILSSDFLMGETYDARREFPDWSRPSFNDQSWRPVKPGTPPEVALVPQAGPPVRKLMELPPKSIKPGPGGTFVFDFGQNLVGWARLRVRGQAGTTVILRFAEALNPDGTVYTENLRRAESVDQYTLRGDADETFEPTFTFHGFRYVEVSGYPAQPGPDSITAIVVGSDLPAVGRFECSNALVNQIQSNLLWSQRGNFLEVPTDCPQRDERLGWMADAQVFLPTATFNMDCRAFFAKWMQDVIDSQSAEGGFSDVSPRMTDLNDGAPAWGDAGVFVPWTLYQAYGDSWILEKCFNAMSAWIDYLHNANPNHLWQNRLNGNMGDWLNINAETPKDLLATAYFAQSTRVCALAADILNRPKEARRLHALWEQIKIAFNREYVSEDGSVKGETQTGYALALRFDLLPADLRPLAAKHLAENVHRQGDRLSTGFVGVGLLLFALSDAGYVDLAYKLLLNETFPSWGYTIRRGATTIWERWNGWTDESGFFYPEMNSFNHYAFGSVGQWMYQTIAGINWDPSSPGYQHIILRPQPGGGLTRAAATLDSARGLIKSEWQLKDQRFQWQVTVPPTTTATAHIPATDPAGVEEGGRKIIDNDQITIIDRTGKIAILKLAPGSYDFVSHFNNLGDL